MEKIQTKEVSDLSRLEISIRDKLERITAIRQRTRDMLVLLKHTPEQRKTMVEEERPPKPETEQKQPENRFQLLLNNLDLMNDEMEMLSGILTNISDIIE